MSNIQPRIPRLQPLEKLPPPLPSQRTDAAPAEGLEQDAVQIQSPPQGTAPAVRQTLEAPEQVTLARRFPAPQNLAALAHFLKDKPQYTQALQQRPEAAQLVELLHKAADAPLSSAEVKTLQRFLVETYSAQIQYPGHATGIDGDYGRRTHAALLNALQAAAAPAPSAEETAQPAHATRSAETWRPPSGTQTSVRDFARSLSPTQMQRLQEQSPELSALMQQAREGALNSTQIKSLQRQLKARGHHLAYRGHRSGIDGTFGRRSRKALNTTLQQLLNTPGQPGQNRHSQNTPSSPAPPAPAKAPSQPTSPAPTGPAADAPQMSPQAALEAIYAAPDLSQKARLARALPAEAQSKLAAIQAQGHNLRDMLELAAQGRLNRQQIRSLQTLLVAGGQNLSYPGHATGIDGDFGRRSRLALENVLTEAVTGQAVKSGPFPRYDKMMEDGIVDMTMALGYDESSNGGWHRIEERKSIQALESRGFVRNDARARELLAAVGRSADADYTALYLKENVNEHEGKPVHAIVRLIHSEDGSAGAQARSAAIEGMNESDIFSYGGHARFGSGMDFDGNFQITVDWDNVPDAPAQGRVTYQGYSTLKHLLGGNDATALRRYRQLEADGHITLRQQNDGNIRMSERDLHRHEMGSQLMHDALQGVENTLSEEIDAEQYRLWLFHGCRTEDYLSSVRSEGRENAALNAENLDLVTTRQTLSWSYVTPSLVAFLDGVMARDGSPDLLERLQRANPNKTTATHAMRGFEDNPQRQP